MTIHKPLSISLRSISSNSNSNSNGNNGNSSNTTTTVTMSAPKPNVVQWSTELLIRYSDCAKSLLGKETPLLERSFASLDDRKAAIKSFLHNRNCPAFTGTSRNFGAFGLFSRGGPGDPRIKKVLEEMAPEGVLTMLAKRHETVSHCISQYVSDTTLTTRMKMSHIHARKKAARLTKVPAPTNAHPGAVVVSSGSAAGNKRRHESTDTLEPQKRQEVAASPPAVLRQSSPVNGSGAMLRVVVPAAAAQQIEPTAKPPPAGKRPQDMMIWRRKHAYVLTKVRHLDPRTQVGIFNRVFASEDAISHRMLVEILGRFSESLDDFAAVVPINTQFDLDFKVDEASASLGIYLNGHDQLRTWRRKHDFVLDLLHGCDDHRAVCIFNRVLRTTTVTEDMLRTRRAYVKARIDTGELDFKRVMSVDGRESFINSVHEIVDKLEYHRRP